MHKCNFWCGKVVGKCAVAQTRWNGVQCRWESGTNMVNDLPKNSSRQSRPVYWAVLTLCAVAAVGLSFAVGVSESPKPSRIEPGRAPSENKTLSDFKSSSDVAMNEDNDITSLGPPLFLDTEELERGLKAPGPQFLPTRENFSVWDLRLEWVAKDSGQMEYFAQAKGEADCQSLGRDQEGVSKLFERLNALAKGSKVLTYGERNGFTDPPFQLSLQFPDLYKKYHEIVKDRELKIVIWYPTYSSDYAGPYNN